MLEFQKRNYKKFITALIIMPVLGNLPISIYKNKSNCVNLSFVNAYADTPEISSAVTIDISKNGDIINGKKSISIDKSGKYILTGSNFINKNYIDTEIIVDNDITVDIILDNLNIINDDGYCENSTGYGTVSPLIVNGTANLYTKSNSILSSPYAIITANGTVNIKENLDNNSAKLNLNITNGSSCLMNGRGTVNIEGGNTIFNLNSWRNFINCNLKITGGVVSAIKNGRESEINICNGIINGGILNNIPNKSWIEQPKNDLGEEVFCRSFSGLPKNSKVTTINSFFQNDISTNESGTISDVYVPKADVTFFINGKAYVYSYNADDNSYSETPIEKISHNVKFIIDNQVIYSYDILDGNSMKVLPSEKEFDYKYNYISYGKNIPFTTETLITDDTTVYISKKLKNFNISINGEIQTKEYGSELPKGYIYINSNGYLYKSSVIKENLTAYKSEYDPNENKTYFLISSVDDLKAFSKIVDRLDYSNDNFDNAYINAKVTSNIDCSLMTIQPIAYSYRGTFDGNNHTISNLIIKSSEDYYSDCGFFKHLDGGIIKNLTLNNIDVQGVQTDVKDNINDVDDCNGIYYVTGGLVGSALSGTIENCSVKGTVNGDYVGGLVGDAANSTVRNCYSEVENTSFIYNNGNNNQNNYYNCYYIDNGKIKPFYGENNK